MEIERKYLLHSIPFNLSPYPKTELTQAYISTNPTIRIRKAVSANKTSYILTVKSSGMLAREEFELPLTPEQYQNLLLKIETEYIVKFRYEVPIEGGLIAELDVYQNALLGLVTVEVEFPNLDAAQAFTPPAWFGRDVTFNPAYKNSNLIRRGLPI